MRQLYRLYMQSVALTALSISFLFRFTPFAPFALWIDQMHSKHYTIYSSVLFAYGFAMFFFVSRFVDTQIPMPKVLQRWGHNFTAVAYRAFRKQPSLAFQIRELELFRELYVGKREAEINPYRNKLRHAIGHREALIQEADTLSQGAKDPEERTIYQANLKRLTQKQGNDRYALVVANETLAALDSQRGIFERRLEALRFSERSQDAMGDTQISEETLAAAQAAMRTYSDLYRKTSNLNVSVMLDLNVPNETVAQHIAASNRIAEPEVESDTSSVSKSPVH